MRRERKESHPGIKDSLGICSLDQCLGRKHKSICLPRTSRSNNVQVYRTGAYSDPFDVKTAISMAWNEQSNSAGSCEEKVSSEKALMFGYDLAKKRKGKIHVITIIYDAVQIFFTLVRTQYIIWSRPCRKSPGILVVINVTIIKSIIIIIAIYYLGSFGLNINCFAAYNMFIDTIITTSARDLWHFYLSVPSVVNNFEHRYLKIHEKLFYTHYFLKYWLVVQK